mgnify:CR=1 FL=1
MSKDALFLKNQLCHPIYSASNALQRVYKRILDPLGITYPQYLIMMALWEQDGVNIHAITEATYLDSGTLTPLLQKLKAKGLIDIKPLAEDRRNKLIHLTKKGAKLREKAQSVPETLSCLIPFKPQEFMGFKKQVEELYSALLEYEKTQ